MKLTVERKPILSAMKILMGGVCKSLPVLGCVRLEARDFALHLEVTNLDARRGSQVDAEVFEPGIVCVNAKRFFRFLSELPDDVEDIDIEVEGSALELRADGIQARQMLFPHEEFPARESVTNWKPALCLKEKDFRQCLANTAVAMSTDPARYALNAVLLQVQEKRVKFVATDGRRLMRVALGGGGFDEDVSPLLPGHAVKAMLEMMVSDGADPMHLGVTDKLYSLQLAGGRWIMGKLTDGNFPSLTGVLPAPTHFLELNCADFLAMMDRVRKMEKAPPVNFVITKDAVTVAWKCPEVGEWEETRGVVVEFPKELPREIHFTLNGAYLDGLDGAIENLFLGFESPENASASPILFQCLANGMDYVIMPMRPADDMKVEVVHVKTA